MPAVLGLEWLADLARLQRKRDVLELRYHLTTGEPAKVATILSGRCVVRLLPGRLLEIGPALKLRIDRICQVLCVNQDVGGVDLRGSLSNVLQEDTFDFLPGNRGLDHQFDVVGPGKVGDAEDGVAVILVTRLSRLNRLGRIRRGCLRRR